MSIRDIIFSLRLDRGNYDQGMNRAQRSANNLGRTSLGGLSAGMKGLAIGAAAAAAGIAAAGAGLAATMASGLKLNSSLEEAKAQFEVFTGSATKADAIIASLSERANVTPFETKDYVAGGTALMSAAEGSKDKLMELMKTAEMLTVMNPAEGLAGASVALKNALSGDFTSFQDRFNIDKAKIQEMKDAGLSGQELVRAVLKANNITEDSVAKLGTTMKGRWSTVMSFVDNFKMKLSKGLFDWLSTKVGGLGDWISQNQQWILDTASGLGTMIAGVVSSVAANVSSWWQSGKVAFFTTIEFIAGLKDKIVSSWTDGTLVTGILGAWSELFGAGMLLAFEALKLVGNFCWNGMLNGFPALVGILGKMLVDAINKTFPTLSSMIPGLDTAGDAFGIMAKEGSEKWKDQAGQDLTAFGGKSKEIIGGLGLVGGDMMQGLGIDDAKARGTERAGQASGLFSSDGILAKAHAIGATERAKQEAAQAAINWGQTAPAAPKAASEDDELAAEKYNAQVQRRKPRTKEQMKIQLVTQQPMHAVGMY